MDAESQDAWVSADHERKGLYSKEGLHSKEEIFKSAVGRLQISTHNELIIRGVRFKRRGKRDAFQIICTANARGYHSEYGIS